MHSAVLIFQPPTVHSCPWYFSNFNMILATSRSADAECILDWVTLLQRQLKVLQCTENESHATKYSKQRSCEKVSMASGQSGLPTVRESDRVKGREKRHGNQ